MKRYPTVRKIADVALSVASDGAPGELVAVHLRVGEADRVDQRVHGFFHLSDTDAQSGPRRKASGIALDRKGRLELAGLDGGFGDGARQEQQEFIAAPP